MAMAAGSGLITPSPPLPPAITMPARPGKQGVSARMSERARFVVGVKTRESLFHWSVGIYRIFMSFEDYAAREKRPALSGQMAQSHNLALIWLKILVF